MPRKPLALELQSGKSPSFLAAFHAPFWSVPLGILRVDRALTFRPIQALCPTNQPTSDLREEAGEQWTETLHWHNAKKKKICTESLRTARPHQCLGQMAAKCHERGCGTSFGREKVTLFSM